MYRFTGLLAMLLLAAPVQSQEVIFIPVKIDGPVHNPLQNSYWFGPFSETASVADLDNDGDYDIAAGRNWYEAPLWLKHERYRSGAEPNGPETESNSEFALDVDFDGWADIVSSGWMFLKGSILVSQPRTCPRTRRAMGVAQDPPGVQHGRSDPWRHRWRRR